MNRVRADGTRPAEYVDSDDQRLLRRTTKDFLRKNCSSDQLRAMIDGASTNTVRLWTMGAELGWSSLLVSPPVGAGTSIASLSTVVQETGGALFPGPIIGTNVVAAAMDRWGGASRLPVLKALVDGSTVGAWCIAAISGPWTAETAPVAASATPAGWRLDGVSSYVQDADIAGSLLVTARAEDGYRNLLLPLPCPGVTVRRQQTLDLTRRFFSVSFHEAEVHNDSVINEPDTARQAVNWMLRAAQVLVCADSTGGAVELLARTVRYSQQRSTFGRPIGSYQAIKHKLADMLVGTEAATVAVRHAARMIDEEDVSAAAAASVAKTYIGRMFSDLAGESLQIHGGIGFAWVHDCHLFLRRAKTNEVLFGSPSWHARALFDLSTKREATV